MSRESYGGGGQYGGGSSSGNKGGNGGNAREQYAVQTQYSPSSVTNTGNGEGTIEPPYIMVGGQKYAVDDPAAIEAQNTVEKESLLGNVIDLYQQYSPLNLALNLGGSLLDGLGNVSKSIQNKAISFDLQNRLEKAYQDPTFDPFTPDASVTQLEQDLKSAQAGEFSQQQYQDRYAPQMNNMGEDRGGDGERQLINALTPFAPYAITNTTPQQSMVNEYFANLGMGQQPLSSSLQTSYNNAKNNVSSILGTNQQFGYSTAPYGLLSSTNLADNPFNIPYLQQRGLI
jgi:hypothetical protein